MGNIIFSIQYINQNIQAKYLNLLFCDRLEISINLRGLNLVKYISIAYSQSFDRYLSEREYIFEFDLLI
jgi:hypothetical protein